MGPIGVDTRAGHLAALFRWQSGKQEQLENFCTDALASAIVSEPGRFLALLEARDMLPVDVEASDIVKVEVATRARLRLGVRDLGHGPRAFVMIQTRKSHAKTRARVWARLDTISEPHFSSIDAGSMEARGVDKSLTELRGQDALVDWWFSVLTALAKGDVLELCGGGLDDNETDNDTEDDDVFSATNTSRSIDTT